MTVVRAFEDVCTVLGTERIAVSEPGSLIAFAVDAGIADEPRAELLRRWRERQRVEALPEAGLAASVVRAGRAGSRLWIEPTTEGRFVLGRCENGWRLLPSGSLRVQNDEASMAPGRRRAVVVTSDDGRAADLEGDLLLAAMAAFTVGTAARALVDAVAHAGRRYQFGRPIGAFQAVSHRLARAFRDLVGAQELLLHAEQASVGAHRSALGLALARHHSLQAATAAVNSAVQTRGAEGFRLDSAVGVAFRQVQEDRLAAGLGRGERSALRSWVIQGLRSAHSSMS